MTYTVQADLTSFTPSTAIVDQAKTFTVNGNNIPSTVIASIEGMTGLCSRDSYSSTQAKFTCTPNVVGDKDFYVKAQSGGARLAGSGSWTIDVQAATTPNLTSFTPSTAIVDQAKTFTVNGANIPSTVIASVEGMTGLCSRDSYSSTQAKFTCTPNVVGDKDFYVKAQSGGARLAGSGSWTIDVQADTTPNLTSFTPSTAIVDQAKTFTVNGTNIPSTVIASIEGMTGLCSRNSYSSTQAKFTCTPNVVGDKDFYVKVQSGGARLAGSGSWTIDVQADTTPNLTSFTPSTAIVDQAKIFTVNGTNIPSTVIANIEGMTGLCSRDSYSSTQTKFTCTPNVVGDKDFYVKAQSGGARLAGSGSWTIDVQAATTPNLTSFTPSTAIVDQAKTFTVNGTNIPSTVIANIEGMTGLCSRDSYSSTQAKFTCTPNVVGDKDFYVKAQSGGARLAGSGSWSIDVQSSNVLPKPEFKFAGNEIPQILFIGQSYEYSLSFISDLTDKAKCTASFYEEGTLILERSLLATNVQKIVDIPQESQVDRNYRMVCQTFTGDYNNPTKVSEEAVWEYQIRQQGNFSLNVITENGSVTGEGINCPSDCTESYTQESASNSLTATPNTGYKFNNWSLSDNCSSTVDLTQLTINISFTSDCTVNASFIDVDSNPPLITSTDFPNCESEGLEDIKCVKTGFEYNLSFFLTDVDGDLFTIKFEGYPNLDSKNLSGSEVTLNENIKFSDSLLSDCSSSWNMGLLDVCWRKNITVKATVIDEKGLENTSEQTFTLYDLDKYRENETAIAKEKAQQDLDDLLVQQDHKNSAYIEFDEQYANLCIDEIYTPSFLNTLIEGDKRRIHNGVAVYDDLGGENNISYSSKINDIHPYTINVVYGENGIGHNYPAVVSLKYDIVGHPDTNGKMYYDDIKINNYLDKEKAKKILLSKLYIELFGGNCESVDFDTPQLSQSIQSVEELAETILNLSTHQVELKKHIYGEEVVEIAIDIANGTDTNVAKENYFDAFSGISNKDALYLMLTNSPSSKLFFDFLNLEDSDAYLSKEEVDFYYANYHYLKYQLNNEYEIPNPLYYSEILIRQNNIQAVKDIVDDYWFLIDYLLIEDVSAGNFKKIVENLENLPKNYKRNKKKLPRGSQILKVKHAAKRGREIHKKWEVDKIYDQRFGKTHIHEFSIKHPTLKTKSGRPKGYRLDAIKFDKINNQIELRELKPNNSIARLKGEKQLQQYKEVMEYQVKNNADMKLKYGKWIADAKIIIKDVVTYD